MLTNKETLMNQFKCVAERCPDSCCHGWRIMVDDESLERFRKVVDISKNVDWEEGCFFNEENGNCAFLCKDGLCRMIKEHGEEMLCNTCALYPRHAEEYEDVRELSLSLSCPEVVRLYVEENVRFSYDSVTDDSADELEDDFEDFDLFLYDQLNATREPLLKMCGDDTVSFSEKIGHVLELSKTLQKFYDEDTIYRMEDTLKNYDFTKANGVLFETLALSDFAALDTPEQLSEDWSDYLEYAKSFRAEGRFDYVEGISPDALERIYSNILASLLYTYFCGSVYSGCIYGYAAFAAYLPAFVHIMANGWSNQCKRKLSKEELERLIYRMFREIEHSDENINYIVDYFNAKV